MELNLAFILNCSCCCCCCCFGSDSEVCVCFSHWRSKYANHNLSTYLCDTDPEKGIVNSAQASYRYSRIKPRKHLPVRFYWQIREVEVWNIPIRSADPLLAACEWLRSGKFSEKRCIDWVVDVWVISVLIGASVKNYNAGLWSIIRMLSDRDKPLRY
ncbi:uncharacterized protein BO97DRAFT_202087 [Aspergillus homomorphus CBS 101889]|uniref:Uncharacterized protein n=1 Tax=Aspergillus homomorphus (strain CBS 101889) TaxID=1450537 RepID=A0A395HMH6_ASPHC|nr:hypothetical protein BO97DRAFT_202087 [Aspergillus homomorphus CBS 101889]RAL08445.1 hypothetical protein BO97DRAFT_202087 [Aspergillus homomorphus CBS 101889]